MSTLPAIPPDDLDLEKRTRYEDAIRVALPRRWWERLLGGAGINILLVLAVGMYYDSRNERPGLVVWLAVLMCLPTWLVLAVLRRSELARWLNEQRPNIELLDELRARAHEHGSSITGVLNQVLPEPELQKQLDTATKESSDNGRRG